jgi:exosortase A
MLEAVREAVISAKVWQRGARQAVLAGGTVLLTLLFFGTLFPDAVLGAVRVWLESPTFNHCVLVLPISLFMIWSRRGSLASTVAVPDPRAAAAMLVLAVAWLGAAEAGIVEAQQLVVVTMVQVTLWAVLGFPLYRKLTAPFLYLYFLIPAGAYLIPALQSYTARFVVAGLHVLGIPVFSSGAVIEVPAGTFAVAEACAGLRFLVAAVAFGVFFAVITYRSWWRRSAFIVLSIGVPVVANGFRALGLVAAAEWIGSPAAALADHIIYGWIFFSFVLIMLVLIGQAFSDQTDATTAASVGPESPATQPKFSMRMAIAAAACLAAAALGPAASVFMDSADAAQVPSQAPRVTPPWRESYSRTDWEPIVAGPVRSYRQTFLRGPDRVDRFVALYAGVGRRSNAARLSNRDANEGSWSFNSARQVVLSDGRRKFPVQETVWLRGGEKRIVWSFYAIDGRFASNMWIAKWDQFHGYLTRTKCLSAYFALSTTHNADDTSEVAAAEGLLASSEDLVSYLCGPTTAQAHQ